MQTIHNKSNNFKNLIFNPQTKHSSSVYFNLGHGQNLDEVPENDIPLSNY